uniref:Uncharacterized protein n=1 Tax=Anguilla anguilla TaxID=7936 RepID=A0A0E9WPY0_ANGAN
MYLRQSMIVDVQLKHIVPYKSVVVVVVVVVVVNSLKQQVDF